MMLLRDHPGVAKISCEKCQQFPHDMQSGSPLFWSTGRGENKKWHVFEKKDSPDYKPPCRTGIGCPKESPEKAHLYELNVRNLKVVEYWRKVRATSGACLPDDVDDLCLANLAIVDEHMRAIEAQALAKQTAKFLASVER